MLIKQTEKEIVSQFITDIKNLGYNFIPDKEKIVVRKDTPYYVFQNEIGLKEERALNNFVKWRSKRIIPEDLRVYRDKEFHIEYVENTFNQKIKNFHLLPEVENYERYTTVKDKDGFYYITNINEKPYYVYNMVDNRGLVCDSTGVFQCVVWEQGKIVVVKPHTEIPQEYWGKIKIVPKTENIWELQYVDSNWKNRKLNIFKNSNPFLYGDIRIYISPKRDMYIKLIPQGEGFEPTLIDEVGGCKN